MKKIYFLCFYPCQYCLFSDQYMSKDLLAVISILNNCSIYKLLTVILTHADTHAQGHVISLFLLYTECREGNDLWEPMIRKGKATLLPQAHAPATISTSLLLPLTRNSLPDVHRVNVISVDNLLNLSCFKKVQANTTLPVSVVLISDSSFKYRKFCPKTGTLNPRVIWSSHLLLWPGVQVTQIHPQYLSEDLAPPIGSNESKWKGEPI